MSSSPHGLREVVGPRETNEERLRQAHKMEAVGRLAGGIAHDFNNILSVIISYADLVMNDLEPGDPKLADLAEIRDAGRRAAELTRQLLLFSRQQIVAPRILDVDQVVGGMDKMLRRVVGEDVALVTRRGNETLGRVRIDPSNLEQVIMNLVVNARDAMPTGGTLTIETANAVLEPGDVARHGGTAGRNAKLSVRDTGIGIDEATMSRIFEPFFSTKSKDQGTGLGLSTVFGIVHQVGGSIRVTSQLGVGTCFDIYLPVFEGAVEPDRARAQPMRRGSETILLVEDDLQVRAITTKLLQRAGYTVLDAGHPSDALRICKDYDGTIDMLLSDVVMPGFRGPELARRVAAMRPGTRPLFISGYADDSVVRHGAADAEIAYLHKPITLAALTAKIREVLDAPTPTRAPTRSTRKHLALTRQFTP